MAAMKRKEFSIIYKKMLAFSGNIAEYAIKTLTKTKGENMYNAEIIEQAGIQGFELVRRHGARNTLDVFGAPGNAQVFGRGEKVEVLYPDGHIALKKVNIETKTDRRGNVHCKAYVRVNVHGLWVRKNLEGLYVRKVENNG